MVWFIVGMVVLGAAAWWLLQRDKGNTSPVPSRGKTASKALERGPMAWGKQLVIPAGMEACKAARDLEGKCFTLAKAPTLPLAGCAHGNCHCHFEPLADRRNLLKERRSGKERRPTLRFEPGKSDRRDGIDRREENRNPFSTEIDRH